MVAGALKGGGDGEKHAKCGRVLWVCYYRTQQEPANNARDTEKKYPSTPVGEKSRRKTNLVTGETQRTVRVTFQLFPIKSGDQRSCATQIEPSQCRS